MESELTTLIVGILSKLLFQWVKKRFSLPFLDLKQNEEVQLDLQHLEIFIFSSILLSLLPGKMREEKLRYRFLRFGISANLQSHFFKSGL